MPHASMQKWFSQTVPRLLACALVAVTCGCRRNDSSAAKEPDSTAAFGEAEATTPQFQAVIVQLHPDGTYWKHMLTEGEGATLTAVAVETQFARQSAPPLQLRVTFVGHADGMDEYKVSRSVSPSDVKLSEGVPDLRTENWADLPVHYRGEPIIVLDDSSGTTLILNALHPSSVKELQPAPSK